MSQPPSTPPLAALQDARSALSASAMFRAALREAAVSVAADALRSVAMQLASIAKS